MTNHPSPLTQITPNKPRHHESTAHHEAHTSELLCTDLDDPQAGATTAEYGIVMLAAVGFAGLLVVILKSDEVRQMLLNIVQTALSTGA